MMAGLSIHNTGPRDHQQGAAPGIVVKRFEDVETETRPARRAIDSRYLVMLLVSMLV
jgi:hypothetical protein